MWSGVGGGQSEAAEAPTTGRRPALARVKARHSPTRAPTASNERAAHRASCILHLWRVATPPRSRAVRLRLGWHVLHDSVLNARSAARSPCAKRTRCRTTRTVVRALTRGRQSTWQGLLQPPLLLLHKQVLHHAAATVACITAAHAAQGGPNQGCRWRVFGSMLRSDGKRGRRGGGGWRCSSR